MTTTIYNLSMVNVLKFQTLSSFSVLKLNVGNLSWNSKRLVRIANREDPDQTASLEAV